MIRITFGCAALVIAITGTTLDQVYIDTWSIPTPGALALFGLGGLALVRRRR